MRPPRVRQEILIALMTALVYVARLGCFQIDFLAAVPAEPAALIARLIDRDPVNPGLNRTLAAESRDIAKYLQKNFLDHVGGIGRIVQQATDYIEDRLFEALNQRLISMLF